MEFVIPIHPEDLLVESADKFQVSNTLLVETFSDSQLSSTLDDLATALKKNKAKDVISQENFETLFSFLSKLNSLNDQITDRVYDIICSGLSNVAKTAAETLAREQVEEYNGLRNALKMYMFLIHWFLNTPKKAKTEMTAENAAPAKTKGRARAKKESAEFVPSWELESQKETMLSSMINILELDLGRLWKTELPEEDFVNLFSKCATHMLEEAVNVKSKVVRKCLFMILSLLIKKYKQGDSLITTLIVLVNNHEHLASTASELMEMLVREFNADEFVTAVLQEVGKTTPRETGKDTATNLATFVADTTEKLPKHVLLNISLLLPHLNGESYKMRNGIVQAMGFLIAKGFKEDASVPSAQKQQTQKKEEQKKAKGKKKPATAKGKKGKKGAQEEDEEEEELYEDSDEGEALEEMLSDDEKGEDSLLNPEGIAKALEEAEKEEQQDKALTEQQLAEQKAEEAELREKTFYALLDILQERVADINSYTRAKVLQTFTYLYQQQPPVVPLNRLEGVLTAAIGRLRDTSANVRKAAIVLLTTILQYNPFGPSLKLSDWQSKLIAAEQQSTATTEAPQEGENPAEKQQDERTKVIIQLCKNAVRFIELHHEATPTLRQLLGSKNSSDVLSAVQYFVTAKNFYVQTAMDGVRKMLMLIFTKEVNVKEAVVASFKQLYVAEGAGKEQALKIAKNFISLTQKATLGELTCLEELLTEMMIKKTVPNMVINILWEILAMRFSPKAAQAAAAGLDPRGAMIVLSMLANADPEIIRSKLPLLMQTAFGPRWKEDTMLARYACVALQKLGKKPVTSTAASISAAEKAEEGNVKKEKKGEDKENAVPSSPAHTGTSSGTSFTYTRMKPSHPVFARLSDVVKDRTVPHVQWYSAAEQAISAIYTLSEHPDHVCASIIKEMAAWVFPESSAVARENMSQDDIETAATRASVGDLSKLFFVIGHVSLKQLVQIEIIQAELRKRRAADNANKAEKGNKKTKAKQTEASAIEQELGLAQAAADTEVEFLQAKAEKEIVAKNLIGSFAPLISLVSANAGNKFSDHTLRASSVLALCKLMCVSSEFCEKHLQLLFTILKTAPEPSIRSNIVIALGDLAFRFPNLIEPWSHYMYAPLHDRDPHVRKNTLMVLSHLILNDMIRVKAQISEMAVCLEDKETRVSDLSKLFFHELAQKGNVLYNLIPELIGSLSAPQEPLPNGAQSFRTIMKYIFSFIEKEKQAEGLVEKLLLRFKTTKASDLEQSRNLAYCLSLLNYNDKALKKLLEMSKCFQDRLDDPELGAHFAAILIKARKFARADLKEVLAELEKVIDPSLRHAAQADAGGAEPMEGVEGGEGVAVAATATQAGKKQGKAARTQSKAMAAITGTKGKQAKKAAPKKGKGRRGYIDSDEEEDEDEDVRYDDEGDDSEPESIEEPVSKASAPTSGRAQQRHNALQLKKAAEQTAKSKPGSNKRKAQSKDEDEIEDESQSGEEEEEEPPKKVPAKRAPLKPKAAPKKAAGRGKKNVSNDSEEDRAELDEMLSE